MTHKFYPGDPRHDAMHERAVGPRRVPDGGFAEAAVFDVDASKISTSTHSPVQILVNADENQCHARAFGTVCRVGDQPAVEFVDAGDPGSSTPQQAVLSAGSPAMNGVGSMFQSLIPSRLRATARCDTPVRSSTRHRSTVWPSTRAAPGLNT
jgi:hypothetical protein